jgi:hypothetical protein
VALLVPLLLTGASREGLIAVKAVLFVLALFVATSSLSAQSVDPSPEKSGGGATVAPVEPPPASPLRSAVELQFFNFDNFFQVPASQGPETVNALGAAYRVIWTRPKQTPDVYGRVSVLRYGGDASETSYTGQLGVMKYGSVHWYDAAVEHTRNGYSFELDETRASANITSFWGHYSYPVAKDWRIGADTYNDRVRFDTNTGMESDYRSLIAVARYSGFGKMLKPRAGYAIGHRDSADPGSEVDDRYWYLQLGTEPIEHLDLSVRYQSRTLDYDSIDRTEDRRSWQLRAAYRHNERLTWVASYRLEDVDSSVPGGDFDRNTASVTLTWWF